jgi:hypothetical protein
MELQYRLGREEDNATFNVDSSSGDDASFQTKEVAVLASWFA